MFERLGLQVDSLLPELGVTVADALLATHRSYLSVLRPVIDRRLAKGIAHITGGGITENLPRILPDGVGAEIRVARGQLPELFRLLQDAGAVAEDEMFRAFNMGIGTIVACAAEDGDAVLALASAAGEDAATVIGTLTPGEGRVQYV